MLPRVPGPAPDFPTLLYMLGVGSVVWYAVAIALPFMLWGARHLHADAQGWLRVSVASAGTIISLIIGSTVLQYLVIYGTSEGRPSLAAYLPTGLRLNVLPWLAIAGVVGLVEARRRAAKAELERERLRAQVAEQRLIALSGQLRPHFLFNTLQAIST